VRVARSALSPSQTAALGIERPPAPHFGNGRPFPPRGSAELVKGAVADGIPAFAKKLAELRTGQKSRLIFHFYLRAWPGCFPALSGDRFFGLEDSEV
jgi:hypothetical protein